MAYVWFLSICVMWGSSFILMKKASLAFTPIEIAALRVLSGAAALGLIGWWQRTIRSTPRRNWGLIGFLIVIGYAWPYAVQPYLVAQHGSAFIGMTVSFVPLLTILVSIPVLRVYPTLRQAVGVTGALACLAILVFDGVKRDIPWSDLALAGSVPLAYAFCNTFIRRDLQHVHPLNLSFQSLGGAGLLLLPLTATTIGPQVELRQQWGLALTSALLLGTLGTGVAIWLFNRLIHERGPLFAGMVTNLVPIGAVLWGWLDRERVTGTQLLALGGIVVMVFVVQLGSGTRTKP